jgi:hypothetical protein
VSDQTNLEKQHQPYKNFVTVGLILLLPAGVIGFRLLFFFNILPQDLGSSFDRVVLFVYSLIVITIPLWLLLWASNGKIDRLQSGIHRSLWTVAILLSVTVSLILGYLDVGAEHTLLEFPRGGRHVQSALYLLGVLGTVLTIWAAGATCIVLVGQVFITEGERQKTEQNLCDVLRKEFGANDVADVAKRFLIQVISGGVLAEIEIHLNAARDHVVKKLHREQGHQMQDAEALQLICKET